MKLIIILKINSKNQELIHHIGEKAWWRNLADFRGSYFMIFALDFTQISQTFIEQNIFVFTKVYCCNNLFIHNLFFFYAHYNHLPRRSAFLVLIQQILLYRHCLFHLSTYQQLICLNHHWISWIISIYLSLWKFS